MNVMINEKMCLKHRMTLQEFLLALTIRSVDNMDEVLNNMLNREILVEQNGKYLVTQHWSDVVDEILCDSSNTTGKTDEELLELAKKMRALYPDGKMPGTTYYYRCNNKEIVLKLKKFFLEHGKYTDEEVLNATRNFVASHRGNYRYLPLLKYFISKLKPVEDEDGMCHNVEYSPLADYLENGGGEEEVVVNDDSWLMNSRN